MHIALKKSAISYRRSFRRSIISINLSTSGILFRLLILLTDVEECKESTDEETEGESETGAEGTDAVEGEGDFDNVERRRWREGRFPSVDKALILRIG